MATENLRGHPSPPTPARPRFTLRDRFLSWLVTGPLGRGAAFVLDLGALAWRTLRRRGPDLGGR
jgi:hypothetical protein